MKTERLEKIQDQDQNICATSTYENYQQLDIGFDSICYQIIRLLLLLLLVDHLKVNHNV